MTTRRSILRGIVGALAAPVVAKVAIEAAPAVPEIDTKALLAIDANLGHYTTGRIVSADGRLEIDFDRGVFRID